MIFYEGPYPNIILHAYVQIFCLYRIGFDRLKKVWNKSFGAFCVLFEFVSIFISKVSVKHWNLEDKEIYNDTD